MSEDKRKKETVKKLKLIKRLRANPFFEEIVSEADSENDRAYAMAEFSSYKEITKIAEVGMIGSRYENPEVLKKIVTAMEETGLMEIIEFNEKSGYLRCKMFLPTSDFDGMKN